MKLVCISDTHTLHDQIKDMPPGDVLIHAGDFTGQGKFFETRDFNLWLKAQDYNNKIVIAGNHELGFESRTLEDNAHFLSGGTYLQDSCCIIGRLKFYGSPWTPRFYDWEFNVDRDKIWQYWERIPKDVDVLITHGPPKSIMDLSRYGNERAGCKALKSMVQVLPNLKAHVFGHMHSGYGVEIGHGGITFVNACICDEKYEVHRKPIVIEIG